MVKRKQPDASKKRVRGWTELWLRLPLNGVPDILTEEQIDLDDYIPSRVRLPLQEFTYEMDILQYFLPGGEGTNLPEQEGGLKRPFQAFDLINLVFVEPSMKIMSYLLVPWPYNSGALLCPNRILVSKAGCAMAMLELFRKIPIKPKE